MATIGLLDIPPEIQLQIAEFAETRQTLKALSVTSRSLRSIAQSILFKKLRIDLGTKLSVRGSVDDLLANPRICAAIRVFHLRGPSSTRPHSDDEQLSHIQKVLPKMIGLKKALISYVNLSKTFLDALLGTAANMPLQISLERNIYPDGVIPTPHIRLQISYLDLRLTLDYPSLEFCRSLFHASATTLTRLNIQGDEGKLVKLADIDLPFLHDLTISGTEVSRTGAAAFITAQKAIRKLNLWYTIRPLPPIPPNALPNLQELKASPELVNQLVPGRPVEAIEVIFSLRECDEDWFGEEVTQSTARVRMLRAYSTTISDARMVKRMVTILPFLENLWLSVFDDVSWPFRSITKTLAAHFPSGTPQCRRSPHYTQMPQVPTLQSVLS